MPLLVRRLLFCGEDRFNLGKVFSFMLTNEASAQEGVGPARHNDLSSLNLSQSKPWKGTRVPVVRTGASKLRGVCTFAVWGRSTMCVKDTSAGSCEWCRHAAAPPPPGHPESEQPLRHWLEAKMEKCSILKHSQKALQFLFFYLGCIVFSEWSDKQNKAVWTTINSPSVHNQDKL